MVAVIHKSGFVLRNTVLWVDWYDMGFAQENFELKIITADMKSKRLLWFLTQVIFVWINQKKTTYYEQT